MAPKAAAVPDAKAKAKAKAKPDAKAKAKKEKADEPEVPKLDQPDRKVLEEKTAGVNEDIKKLQGKQADLAKQISERSGGKDGFFKEKEAIRSELNEVSGEMDVLHKQKEEVLGSVQASKQEGIEMKGKLDKMKKTIGYTNVQDIDERIASIEFKLWTESVPLKEEKKYLIEIQELKKSRPKVTQMHALQGAMAGRDTGGDKREQGKEIKAQIAICMERKKKIMEKLTALNESRKEQMGDLPQLIEEREGLNKKIQEKIKERNQLRDEFREEEQKYRDYQNELRIARQAKAQEERDERQREYNQRRLEREAEKLDDQPYVQEITLIEQTMAFLKSLTPNEEKEEKVEAKEIAHNNPDGTEVLAKKKDRDEEMYYAATAKGKKGKTNKKKETPKSIKHNAETFRLFEKLKLDAPITTEEIPDLLTKLAAKKEDYEAKVKEWELKREEMKRKILEEGIIPAEEEKKEETEKEEKQDEEKEKEEE